MKVCIRCNNELEDSSFEKGRNTCKKCRNEQRVLRKQKKKEEDPIKFYCDSMSQNAKSRMISPSKQKEGNTRDKTYRKINGEKFDFTGYKELSEYLYDNFKEEICKILTENEIPSIDRVDSNLGYVKNNIRVISSYENMMDGIENTKKRIKVVFDNNEEKLFNTTTECVQYFGFKYNESNRVKGWTTGLYNMPDSVKEVLYL